MNILIGSSQILLREYSMKRNPFKFLDSYTENDRDIFFGRENEIEELYRRVFLSNLVLIYGASGTGKTSLVQCGLYNKFQKYDWLPVFIRRGENIFKSLYKELSANSDTKIKENSSLRNWIQAAYRSNFKPVYLIFDQFEEIFIFGNEEERLEFFKEIDALLASDLQFKIIFILREEYLAYLTEYEEIIPNLFDNRMRIEEITRKNAENIINGPCNLLNINIENSFAHELINRLAPSKTKIDLTYLQVYLDKCIRKAAEKNEEDISLDVELLDKLGRIGDVLADFLDEQVALQPEPANSLTVLKAFVSGDGTKKSCTLEEIKGFTKNIGLDVSIGMIENTIHKFIDLRILRDKDQNNRFELRHDILAEKIFERITRNEKEILEIRRTISDGYEKYDKRNILMGEEDLKFIYQFKNKLILNEKEKEYISESEKSIRRKRNKKIIYALMIIFGIFLVLVYNYISTLSQKRALEQTNTRLTETYNSLSIQMKLADEENKRANDEAKRADDEKQKVLIARDMIHQQLSKTQEAEKKTKDEKERAEAAEHKILELDAWAKIKERNYESALSIVTSVVLQDSSWLVFRAMQAHCFLLQNKYLIAENIYLKYRRQYDERIKMKFSDIVLDDFKKMREENIIHPDMEKIENLLKNGK
jgi:hypothetical protein